MISFNTDQKKRLMLVAALAVTLPAVVAGAQLIKQMRSQAAGSYEVGLKVFPVSGSFHLGDNVKLQLKMNKIASRPITVSGAQAVLTVGDKFRINNATCLPPFNGLPFIRINAPEVTIFCAVSTSASPVNLTTTELAWATLDLTVEDFASDGPTQVTFNSTRVTEAGVPGQAPDVSTAGSLSTYTIIATPPCPRGEVGNLDCSTDSCIDTLDFELFRQAYGLTLAEINVPLGQATPDMVVDALDQIDTADYEIFRANFGTCQ